MAARKWRVLRTVLRVASFKKAKVSPAPPAPPFWPNAADTEELAKVDAVLPSKTLFISNWRGVEKLSGLGVTHIAAIGEEFVEDAAPGIKYFHHDISDDDHQASKMGEHLRKAAKFVHEAINGGGKCLVHCAAGISRSATVVLAYRMIYGKLTLRAAFAELYAARRCVWPNDGFMEALIALEKKLFKGKTTIKLKDYVEWGEYDPDEAPVERVARMSRASTASSRSSRISSVAKAITWLRRPMLKKQDTTLDLEGRAQHQKLMQKRNQQKQRESQMARESRRSGRSLGESSVATSYMSTALSVEPSISVSKYPKTPMG